MTTPAISSLPNLIIAGIRKGGTTSLAAYLAQHPDICSSELKKVGYFLPLKYGDAVASLDSYAAHFSHHNDERYRMEATTGYFLGGEVIANAIRTSLPDARVLISLREPVDTLWSYYRFVRSHARIDKSMTFEHYLSTCRSMMASGEDLERTNNAYLAYRGGFYDKPLNQWACELQDHLRVVFFDDLRVDAETLLSATCEWLRIDPGPVSGFELEVHNKSVEVKNMKLQRRALQANRAAKKFFRRHRGLKRALRSTYYSMNKDRSERQRLDPGLRRELEAEYAPSNAAVASLLRKRNLSGPAPAWLAKQIAP